MFRSFSMFIPAQEYGQRPTRHGARSLGWGLMAPGLGLIGAALAMIIWPELLAYFVASLLQCGGTVVLMLSHHLLSRGRTLVHAREGDHGVLAQQMVLSTPPHHAALSRILRRNSGRPGMLGLGGTACIAALAQRRRLSRRCSPMRQHGA
jgi:hypothetical protein